LDELLTRVKEVLSTDTAAILLLDRTRGELVARGAKGIEEEVEEGVRIPLGRGFAGTIAATGRPVVILDVDHSMVLNPILRRKGIRSLLGVPLIAQGKTLGVLHVGTLVTRRFTSEDMELLQLVGDRVALALNAGLYERERAVARKLQRSLLPERLPKPPGVRLAARYLPVRGGEVGGDWYDAFPLPNGSLAVAIGDVVGRGINAAAAMGKLRNSLRAYSLELSSPSDLLDRLDRLIQHFEPDDMATVLYGVIDPVQLTFRFASAAHIPPLLREPDGSVRVLSSNPHPPLGAGVGGTFTETVEQLRPGGSIVLCTDGLIERRGWLLDEGLRQLREACTGAATPDERCDLIIDLLTDDDEIEDDVALLVIEMALDDGDHWHVSLPAEPRQLVILRRLLERWLTQRGVAPRVAYDVLAASGESLPSSTLGSWPRSGAST
jgi:putative methionine-R-sulfoxide reductase with GAF domain